MLRDLMKVLAVAGLFGASTTIGAAFAADAPTNIAAGEAPAKQLLLLMDKDKSGKVSKDEFMGFFEHEFTLLDTNKSGALDVGELSKLHVRASDSDKKFITGEAAAKQLLQLMDKDANNEVSKQEYMGFISQEFTRLDINHDGELDVDELTKARVHGSMGHHAHSR